MRTRCKTKETKELKKKRGKKENNVDQTNENLSLENLENKDQSKFKFFFLFDEELKKLENISTCYEDIYQRFLLNLEEFKNDNNTNRNKKNDLNICDSPSNNCQQNEINIFEKLAQKFKTPMESKIKSVFNSLVKKNNEEKHQTKMLPKFNINNSPEEENLIIRKSKKRSAIEVSLLSDDDKEDGNKSIHIKSSKTNAKKKSKTEIKENSKHSNHPKTEILDKQKEVECQEKLNFNGLENKDKNESLDKKLNNDEKIETKKKKIKKTKKNLIDKNDSNEKAESGAQNSTIKKKTIKSVIDERKARLSKSRTSEKIKSNLKIKKFLNETISNNKESQAKSSSVITQAKEPIDKIKLKIDKSSHKETEMIQKDITPKNNNNPNFDNDSATPVRRSQKIRISDVNANICSPKDEKLLLDIKNNIPKLIVQKLPNNILASGKTVSANHVVSIQQKSTINITQSQLKNRTLVAQTTSMSSIKPMTTPMKGVIYQSLSNLNTVQQNNRQSVVRIWERNTPSKLTRTELEEKRKQEFYLKEKKEKERLEEIARQKALEQEKKKKNNDERHKKMMELKKKNDEMREEKKKREEIEEAKRRREEQEAKENEKKKVSISQNIKPFTNIMASATKKANMVSVIKSHNNPVTLTSNTDSILSKKFTIQNQKFQTQETIINIYKNEQESDNNLQNTSKIHQCASGILLTSNKENTENINPYCEKNNLESTYILNSPKKPPLKETKFISQPTISSYDVTPLQVPKLKDDDNYDVSGLKSEDETDDEDEPNKPVPNWAKEPLLSQKAQMQSSLMVNFTKLFRASCQHEVILEKIFRVKRKKFTERSSSAIWSSPPLWRTNGLTGEESFRKFHKNF